MLYIRYDRRHFIISSKLVIRVNRSKKQLEQALAKCFRLITHIVQVITSPVLHLRYNEVFVQTMLVRMKVDNDDSSINLYEV